MRFEASDKFSVAVVSSSTSEVSSAKFTETLTAATNCVFQLISEPWTTCVFSLSSLLLLMCFPFDADADEDN